MHDGKSSEVGVDVLDDGVAAVGLVGGDGVQAGVRARMTPGNFELFVPYCAQRLVAGLGMAEACGRPERQLKRGAGAEREHPYARVRVRLGSFFGDRHGEIDVVSLRVFGDGRAVYPHAPDHALRGLSPSASSRRSAIRRWAPSAACW